VAQGAGINALLHKPITLTSLRQCLSKQFTDKNQQPQRQAANLSTFMQIAKHLPEQTVKNKLNLLHNELLCCIEQIKQALPEEGNTKIALHRLTSLSATLGLEQLTDQCSALEQQLQELEHYQLKEKAKLSHD
jgi:HPt (histidine-containing phosphotransfer) domain-containing protein